MSRQSLRRRFGADLLEPRLMLDATVVFNELMYNPAGVDETLEYIELHNEMAVDMDLSGWRLDGGVNYTFPEGTILGGGDRLLIAADVDALETATGLQNIEGPYVGQLANDGEQIELRDRSDRQMDIVDYRDEDDWPVAADGSGASLSKRHVNLGSEPPESWTYSPQVGGTPGLANFPDPNEPAETVHLIPLTTDWRYDDSGADLGTEWRNLGYDDSGWSVGSALPQSISNVTATASTEYTPDGRLAIDAVNGNGLMGDTHSADVGTMWLTIGADIVPPAPPDDNNPEITFNLGAVRRVEEMRIWNYNEYRPDLPSRIAELLGRGVKQFDVYVAGADQVYSPFMLDAMLPVVTPATWNTDFSVRFPLGIDAQYIKFDIDSNHNGKNFNSAGSDDQSGNFTGLSEVQFLQGSDILASQVGDGPPTHYFRKEFTLNADPALTQLLIDTTFDDGAVYYVNGVEIARHNMPAGDVTFATAASTEILNRTYTGLAPTPDGGLVQGVNVLAVEVHQISPPDGDLLFGTTLSAIVSPPDPVSLDLPLAINEVSGGGSGFSVELVNKSSAPVAAGGYVIRSSAGGQHVLPAQMIPGDGFVPLTAAQLGFTPAAGDRLFLLSPSQDVIADAAEIKTTARGRSPDGDGQWLRPSALTPGAANTFSLRDEIVINEVMYHHRPDAATGTVPAIYEVEPVLPVDAVWKYNRTFPASFTSTWHQTNYTVGAGGWLSGQGLLGRETTPAALPELLRTTFPRTGDTAPYSMGVLTYYYQIEFNYDGATTGSELLLRHVIDDGAVFYLNGADLNSAELTDLNGGSTRFLMPASPAAITRTTLALAPVDNAAYSSYISLDPADFNVGLNRLSVEVHQQATNSTDTVFGLELIERTLVTPAIPGDPFSENDEEWVELYNRSGGTVDISGWQLDKAVSYTFPPGTVIGGGEYLVVANNPAALAAQYPGIAIVGDYEGSLGNESDRILLRDAVGNPADEVEYFENGRWPVAADGNGSSLELRDPFADNSAGEAWAASDESDTSPWNTYTYSGAATPSAVGPDGVWQEFLLGMLDDGEVLLDDIEVRENGVQILANSTFNADPTGACPIGWRCRGNHQHSEVIVDPDNAANKVLRFLATGATEHMSNHLEATFIAGQAIDTGANYQISFKAKWITGTPLLNSRLYFNRLPKTTSIAQPLLHGTPGTQNSAYVANIGPTYENLRHDPAVPAPFSPVTVSVSALDPDGVASMTLYYSVNSGAFTSVAMSHQGGGVYAGGIPGLAAGAIVQFYVEGTDANAVAATSHFPAAGPESRALYKVDDGLASNTGINNLRIIVTPADATWLHTDINLMSNDFVPATVIYNESEVFYGASVRLSGSQRARPFQPRLAFMVRFPSEQLFRGVHGSFILDRSDSTGFGQRELLVDHVMGAAGVVPALYNDLIHIMTPRPEHTGGALLEMARYSQNYLDEQFDDGGEGALFEYEYIYYPTTANAQGYKLPDPDGVVGTGLVSLGDDPERYRWTYLVKNNRGRDDFSRLMQWLAVQQTAGATYTNQIGNVTDIDQFLRASAFAASTGYGDQWGGDGSGHNAQFYVRPEDNKVLYFPHDTDAFFSTTRPLVGNNEINKLINDSAWPNRNNFHNYYGHLHDIVSNTYNGGYMTPFANNYESLLPTQAWDSWLSDLVSRSNFVLTNINSTVPVVPYAITTAGPLNVGAATTATVQGTGWVNVRELRLAGSDRPLNVTWTGNTAWRVVLPVDDTTGLVTIEAYDFRGNLIGSASINITSTAARPIVDQLRVVELMYNPAGDDASEYFELMNVSATPIPTLAGVQFTDGVTFTLPNITLGPGERIVVVRDMVGFEVIYGNSIPIAGSYTGSALENNGESITLVDAEGALIQELTFDDAGLGWHPTTDGEGFSLVVLDETSDAATWSDGSAWRPSFESGGSPGESDTLLGDFNGDQRVSLADLAYLHSRLGTASGATKETGDLSGDGAVSRVDAAMFAQRFGRSYDPPAPSRAASPTAPVAESSSRGETTLRATRRVTRPTTDATIDAAIEQLTLPSIRRRR